MDSYMARTRYTPRRPAAVQKHRRTPQSTGWLKRLIALQTIVCIILLLMIVIIKGIHISATDFISRQVDYVLSHNVELKNVFNYVGNLAADVRNSIAPSPADKTGNDGLLAAEGSGTDADAARTDVGATGTDAGVAGSDVSEGNGNAAGTDVSTAIDTASTASSGNENLRQDTADTSVEFAGTGVDSASSGDQAADTADQAADIYENTADNPDGTAYEGESGIGDSLSQPQTSVLAASSDGSLQELPEMTAPAFGSIDTPFGRINGGNANVNFHNGIDIVLKPGSSIVASADGEVAETGISREYGAFIRVSHQDGWQTVYAGCSGFIVQKGEKINRGDVIARVGNSAISVGYHLHFELWKDGKPVDPLEYISVGND